MAQLRRMGPEAKAHPRHPRLKTSQNPLNFPPRNQANPLQLNCLGQIPAKPTEFPPSRNQSNHPYKPVNFPSRNQSKNRSNPPEANQTRKNPWKFAPSLGPLETMWKHADPLPWLALTTSRQTKTQYIPQNPPKAEWPRRATRRFAIKGEPLGIQ